MSTAPTNPEILNLSAIDFQPLYDFVEQNHQHPVSRCLLELGPVHLYMRMTRRLLGTSMGETLDIGDVTIPEDLRGSRLFSAILKRVEALAVRYDRSVYVESIINPIIRGALERRGYHFKDGEYGSAWKTPAELKVESIPEP